jgi:hypothetical protein
MSAIFLALLKKEGLVPVTEHKFHPTRKWRLSLTWSKHIKKEFND